MLFKILTPYPNHRLIDVASLLLRVTFGLLIMRYGYQKLSNFEEFSGFFIDFIGLGPRISLGLAVFAELGCGFLVVIGLLTRPALLPLIMTMLVAIFIAHANDPFQEKEHALLFVVPFISLLILGAGKYSVDYLIVKRLKAVPGDTQENQK